MTATPVSKQTMLACALALLATPAAWSQVSVSINIGPPPLPVYAQPPIPGDGYIWTPGYWAWDPADGDYHWVPGTWVLPPAVGLLWTPGYWAFIDGGYSWHRGYWAPHVGYYGGLNYGYGYTGNGYWGGRWERDHFRYNTAVNNVPQGRVHEVYREPVAARPAPRESYTGGPSHYRGPNPAERRFEAAHHDEPTREQAEHEHRAMTMPEQRMSNNHGAPPTAATPRPGGFGEPGVEHVREAPERRAPQMHSPQAQGGERPQAHAQGRPEPRGNGREDHGR